MSFADHQRELRENEPAEPITEDWLKESGFKWHQLDRQPAKHWLLWLGDAVRARDGSLTTYEDIGIEVSPWVGRSADAARDRQWFCWLRSDAAHRYHRFIHLRYVDTREDLVRLIESISGQPWDPANNMHGSMQSPNSGCARASTRAGSPTGR